LALVEGLDNCVGNFRAAEVERAVCFCIQVFVHPGESLAGIRGVGWRIEGLGKAAIETPRGEEPFEIGFEMWEAAVGVGH
jgi:hypothetical protein